MEDEQEVDEQHAHQQAGENQGEAGNRKGEVFGDEVGSAVDAPAEDEPYRAGAEFASECEAAEGGGNEFSSAATEGHGLTDSVFEGVGATEQMSGAEAVARFEGIEDQYAPGQDDEEVGYQQAPDEATFAQLKEFIARQLPEVGCSGV